MTARISNLRNEGNFDITPTEYGWVCVPVKKRTVEDVYKEAKIAIDKHDIEAAFSLMVEASQMENQAGKK